MITEQCPVFKQLVAHCRECERSFPVMENARTFFEGGMVYVVVMNPTYRALYAAKPGDALTMQGDSECGWPVKTPQIVQNLLSSPWTNPDEK